VGAFVPCVPADKLMILATLAGATVVARSLDKTRQTTDKGQLGGPNVEN
jgi:hypothetical protein